MLLHLFNVGMDYKFYHTLIFLVINLKLLCIVCSFIESSYKQNKYLITSPVFSLLAGISNPNVASLAMGALQVKTCLHSFGRLAKDHFIVCK